MGKKEDVPGVVVREFLILREGWEMDNLGWITEDGKVYTTSHGGRPFAMSIDEVQNHIDETNRSLAGLFRARDALEAK